MTREEEADRDLRHTRFSPGTPLLLCLALLLILVAVPIIDGIAKAAHGPSTDSSAPPAPSPSPSSASPNLWDRVLPSDDAMQAYEKSIENASATRRAILPRIQAALTPGLGMGSGEVSVGRDGWLFYHNDLNYVTGPPFLDYDHTTVDEMVSINAQLKAAGIQLIVLPIPPKPAVYPEKISKRPVDGTKILHNPSYSSYLAQAQQNGIVVLDPTPILESAKQQSDSPLFLKDDTHWTPEGMECVATALADQIRKTVTLPPVAQANYTERPLPISQPPDLINLLGLSKNQTIYPDAHVTVRQVLTPQGQLLKTDKTADVLIIGDSLSEYYKDYSASLAERLSFHLGRPVDRIADPSRGLRAMNVAEQELTKDPSRLKGKRLVIWEFNDRTLCEHRDPVTLPMPPQTSAGH